MSNDANDLLGAVAVIGMAGRFPGANNLDEFWRNLREGVECITFYPDEELAAAGVPGELLKAENYVKAGSRLQDVELFDASFFGFTPREAEITDPQHRLLLECAWEALEGAGYIADAPAGRVGVYVGAGTSEYILNVYAHSEAATSAGEFQIEIGNDKDYFAPSISYRLNLTGPSINIQTSCSTSLVAIHTACQGLIDYECDMALAGGVSVRESHRVGYSYQEGGVLSPDGHCRAFDAKAKGTIPGSGAGVVVLKRLEDALKDRDTIHAVIIGSAVNNDGSLKVGFTAPSVDGQAEVIAKAIAISGVNPETISYVEAHGTGTPLGDPIEIAALTKSYRAHTGKKGFCAIGSVKTNVGHLTAAAGVAGIIKTVLSLKHQHIPPSLHFEEPNPAINFADSPFYVNHRLTRWEGEDMPRRAAVSSFGIGGTNAHAILEEAPPSEPSGASREWQLLVLSAKTDTALHTASANLAAHIASHPEVNLADVGYTLSAGRRRFQHRQALVCRDGKEAVEILRATETERGATSFQSDTKPPITFMFAGQGSQQVNMGREVYRAERKFRAEVDRCSELLGPHLGFDLRSVLYPAEADRGEMAERLKQTSVAQPAIFVFEYALAKLWTEWGVRPQAMLGHSIGEYVAACLAGVMSLEDALSVVATRGRLMQSLPGGAMLAVPLAEEEIQPLIGDELSLAAVNGPASCVVAGTVEHVEAFQRRLRQRGVESHVLQTSHAFHSKMVEPVLEAFRKHLDGLRLTPPTIPYLSNVSGTWVTAAEATDPDYWTKHLRRTVRFKDCVAELLKEPERVLLEVGPGHTLRALVKRHPDLVAGHTVLSSLSPAGDAPSEAASLQHTLGRLWLAGAEVDWDAFYAGQLRGRVPLPTYPFEREKFWIAKTRGADALRGRQPDSARKTDVADWFYVPLWKQSLPAQSQPGEASADEGSWWIVFVDSGDVGTRLVHRLEQDGHKVVSVTSGEHFAKRDENSYAINRRQYEHYEQLFAELEGAGKRPARIIHLWGVTPGGEQQSRVEAYEDSLSFGFDTLLYLAQAIGNRAAAEPVHVDVVTSDTHRVSGLEEVLRPEKAMIEGPCTVIPKEFQNITCRSIDIAPAGKAAPQTLRLIDHLFEELKTAPTETSVALRGDYRWVQRFEAVRLDESAARIQRLREGGVYLLTGARRGIGRALAEYLAKTFKAKLILIDTSAAPLDDAGGSKHDWPAFEEWGGEAVVFKADCADESQMNQVIADACQRFGEINGVFHGEKISDRGLVRLKTPEAAARGLAPTVKGTLVLENALRGQTLDFFVLSSSVVSTVAGFGQTSECAAASFLDAFAQSNPASRERLTVSVDWGLWRHDDQPSDLSTTHARGEDLLQQERRDYGITYEEGVAALTRILSTSLTQVLVLTHDVHAFIEHQKALTAWDYVRQSGERHSSETAHVRPALDVSYAPPRTEVEQTLAHVWQTLFGIEPVGIHDNFLDLGGHSLLAIQLITRVREMFHVELPLQSLFTAPTIAGLAGKIEAEQMALEELAPDELESLFAEVESLSSDQVQEQLDQGPNPGD